MRRLLGMLIFWLMWPVWYIYFRLSEQRTRVLIVCDTRVLLLKGIFSQDRWGLPGGGVKKSETLKTAAIREIREETGIVVVESMLRKLGTHRHAKNGLSYEAAYFVVELAQEPELKLGRPEVLRAQWMELAAIRGKILNDDAAFALKHYLPLIQTTLL